MGVTCSSIGTQIFNKHVCVVTQSPDSLSSLKVAKSEEKSRAKVHIKRSKHEVGVRLSGTYYQKDHFQQFGIPLIDDDVVILKVHSDSRQGPNKPKCILFNPILEWTNADIKQQVPKKLRTELQDGVTTVYGILNSKDFLSVDVVLRGVLVDEEVEIRLVVTKDDVATDEDVYRLHENLLISEVDEERDTTQVERRRSIMVEELELIDRKFESNEETMEKMEAPLNQIDIAGKRNQYASNDFGSVDTGYSPSPFGTTHARFSRDSDVFDDVRRSSLSQKNMPVNAVQRRKSTSKQISVLSSNADNINISKTYSQESIIPKLPVSPSIHITDPNAKLSYNLGLPSRDIYALLSPRRTRRDTPAVFLFQRKPKVNRQCPEQHPPENSTMDNENDAGTMTFGGFQSKTFDIPPLSKLQNTLDSAKFSTCPPNDVNRAKWPSMDDIRRKMPNRFRQSSSYGAQQSPFASTFDENDEEEDNLLPTQRIRAASCEYRNENRISVVQKEKIRRSILKSADNVTSRRESIKYEYNAQHGASEVRRISTSIGITKPRERSPSELKRTSTMPALEMLRGLI